MISQLKPSTTPKGRTKGPPRELPRRSVVGEALWVEERVAGGTDRAFARHAYAVRAPFSDDEIEERRRAWRGE